MTLTVNKLPCPCGKSSDAFSLDDSGDGYCFSNQCPEGSYFTKEQLEEAEYDMELVPTREPNILQPAKGKVVAIDDRKITAATCKAYGVTVTNEDSTHYYPFYDKDDKIVAIKIRKSPKEFIVSGSFKDALLFGQHLPKVGKYITITEGELDAMSAYQMMGSKYPVVSVKTGVAGAAKDCREHYEYLNSYESIYIVFDADAAGNKAASAVARIFPQKAKIVRLEKYKDPSEYLTNSAFTQFYNEWWAGELYTADGVLYGEKLAAELYKPVARGVDTVWPGLTEITRGMRPHEMWTFGGGTGMGKSEIFKELAYGLIRDGKKVGMIMLEEPPSRTVKGIVGKAIGKRIYLPEVEASPEEMKMGEDKMVRTNNLVIYDHKGMSDFQNIKAKIEYFVEGLGCEFIFLDHITAMAEGKFNIEGAVNSRCHHYMDEFNKMLMAKKFTLMLISHLRKASGTPAEEGGRVRLDDLYGSGAIKQRSHYVFGIEGNQQAERVEDRDLRWLRCLKDRDAGHGTGKQIMLQYDHIKGRLKEYEGEL